MVYRYTDTKDIFSKKKYMYSEIHKQEFYLSFKKNRKKYLKGKYIKINIEEYVSIYKKINNKNETGKFLYNSLKGLIVNNKNKNEKLFSILKSFEVNNKIFEDYNKDITKRKFKNIDNYILLSLNISEIIKKKFDYKFFNTFLKSNDCIIGLIKKKENKNEINFFFLNYILNIENILLNKIYE